MIGQMLLTFKECYLYTLLKLKCYNIKPVKYYCKLIFYEYYCFIFLFEQIEDEADAIVNDTLKELDEKLGEAK